MLGGSTDARSLSTRWWVSKVHTFNFCHPSQRRLQNTDCLYFHPDFSLKLSGMLWYRECVLHSWWSVGASRPGIFLKILEILEILEFRKMHITCLKFRIVINNGNIKASSLVIIVSIYWEVCGSYDTTNFAVFGKFDSFTHIQRASEATLLFEGVASLTFNCWRIRFGHIISVRSTLTRHWRRSYCCYRQWR